MVLLLLLVLLLGLLLVGHLEHVKSVQSEQVLLETRLHLGFVRGLRFRWLRFHCCQTSSVLLTAKQAVDCEGLLTLRVQGELGRRGR